MAPRQLSRPVSKRSPSPIISSENPKGVKNITRKVIKRLEGLGHLEMVDADFSVPEEDELDSPCKDDDVFSTTGLEAVKRPSSDKHHTNGSAIAHTAVSRIDFEIPRKLLHSSIGTSTPFLHVNHSSSVDSRFPHPLSLRFRSKCRFHRQGPMACALCHFTSRPSSVPVLTI
jgi:hypothetical protein